MSERNDTIRISGYRRGATLHLLVFLTCGYLASASRSLAKESVDPGVATAAESAPAVPSAESTPLDDQALEAAHAVIGEIVIRSRPIFDTESGDENRRLFRVANHMHRRTRDGTIRSMLLFDPGDPFSRSVLDESERALRQARYLYDAKIDVLRYEDNTADVSVETRDVWTLGGGVSLGRAGGTNHTRIGLEEKNLFGLGKAVDFRHSVDVDRSSSRFRYRDDNLLGGRSRLELGYGSNSDGQVRQVVLERPFVSLDSRWSAGVRWSAYDQVDSHYVLGRVSDRFRHESRLAEVYGGLSRGRRNDRSARWNAGMTFAEDRFVPAEFRNGRSLPEDRMLAYPWLEFSIVEDHFIKEHDVDRIERTEDFNLGREARVRLGYASTGLGSDRNQTILDGTYASGYVPGDGQLLFLSGHLGGRFGSGGGENVAFGGGVRYLWRDWKHHVLALSLSGDMASNLDGENQLTLGGDSGLRGYPLRYQDGDRRVLFTVEQRFYTDLHLMKLLRVGGAVFADVGRAWFSGTSPDISEPPLRDVGFGLRLSSSRSSRGSMIRLDLAFPLDGDPSISRTQFLVSTGERF